MGNRAKLYRLNSVMVIGNYLPRKCGIATYTTDICEALTREMDAPGGVQAVAMDDIPEGYAYPDRVKFQVQDSKQSDFFSAAEFINVRQFDAVLLQHEYGIFGGKNGSHILFLIKSLRMPVITTLHSVLLEPSEDQKRVMFRLAEYSDYFIVLSETGKEILIAVYGIPAEQIVHIPHGIPDIPYRDPNSIKHQFGVEGRKVVLTFGLLGPGKGIEVILEAMPAVVEKHPDALYLILGATHPNIRKIEKDQYRQSLQLMVSRLGLEDHVRFHNQFVSLELLCQYLSAADVYCTPYPSREQIVSGTLAYAMGAGAAVVSTPYLYAEEMLAQGRGCLVPFNNPGAFANEINRLFSDDTKRTEMRQRAYQHCRKMIWKEVARSHIQLVNLALEHRSYRPRPVPVEVEAERKRSAPRLLKELPEPNLRHLHMMTDSCGMLQHAIYSTPNRREGYCIDDNARALIAAGMYYEVSKDESMLSLIQRYLSFLYDAFNPENRRFRNFMSYDRRWLDEAGSEDSHARALWGLCETVKLAKTDDIRDMATRLFMDALPVAEDFLSPRAIAFTLVGLHSYMTIYGGDATVRRLRTTLAERLHRQFIDNGDEKWPWCEDTLSYANGILPHALILSGQSIPDPPMHDTAVRALLWLMKEQRAPEGHLSFFGNEQWFSRSGQRSSFDQQPLEALNLIGACAAAFRSTKDSLWLHHADRCLRWFLGDNDINAPLYDYKTGGCCDGLQPDGANRNQGAESSLSWLISLLIMYNIAGEEILVDHSPLSPKAPEAHT
jgi:glycosyltransferase involved in cell wall biosynthesis